MFKPWKTIAFMQKFGTSLQTCIVSLVFPCVIELVPLITPETLFFKNTIGVNDFLKEQIKFSVQDDMPFNQA